MKKIVLAENDNEILLRIEDAVELDGKKYKTVRHQWWVNKEKMQQDIHGDGKYIYCRSFAGYSDEAVIKLFKEQH